MESKNESLYLDVIYAALYHNSYLRNGCELPMNQLDIGYIPIIKQVQIRKVTKHRIADFWMLKYIISTAKEQYKKALEHAYRIDVGVDGAQGEDLMKYIVMTQYGKPFSSLAIPEAKFHDNSIVHDYQLVC
eukprot:TRINITY_DN10226_c0_g1_i1.p1 TRINITY_DN10226_c0_g1~~TRINITY_DN10226_c0_g1_i1.p1  ORF type:complete len:131 (+),score=1.11 TRINITY_DN10226_c0_g1_i1:414-806(+)